MSENETPVAVRKDGGSIAVRDPFATEVYHATPDAVITSMFERKRTRAAEFEALGDIAAAPLDAVKGVLKATEADDDALLDYEKQLREALLALSGFKSVVVQMKGAKARIDPLSVRGKFAEIIKACRERIDAEKPAEPIHTYVIRLTCTDKALMSVVKAAAKYGAADVATATAQSDKAVRQIAAWFEANA